MMHKGEVKCYIYNVMNKTGKKIPIYKKTFIGEMSDYFSEIASKVKNRNTTTTCGLQVHMH